MADGSKCSRLTRALFMRVLMYPSANWARTHPFLCTRKSASVQPKLKHEWAIIAAPLLKCGMVLSHNLTQPVLARTERLGLSRAGCWIGYISLVPSFLDWVVGTKKLQNCQGSPSVLLWNTSWRMGNNFILTEYATKHISDTGTTTAVQVGVWCQSWQRPDIVPLLLTTRWHGWPGLCPAAPWNRG